MGERTRTKLKRIKTTDEQIKNLPWKNTCFQGRCLSNTSLSKELQAASRQASNAMNSNGRTFTASLFFRSCFSSMLSFSSFVPWGKPQDSFGGLTSVLCVASRSYRSVHSALSALPLASYTTNKQSGIGSQNKKGWITHGTKAKSSIFCPKTYPNNQQCPYQLRFTKLSSHSNWHPSTQFAIAHKWVESKRE